jgi:hypothetical protein
MPAQYSDKQVTRNRNICFASGALTISATAAKFKTTANLTYTINGIFYALTAVDLMVFSAGHTALAANQSCFFVVCADGSADSIATIKTYQGPRFTTQTRTVRDSTGVTTVTEYVAVQAVPASGSFSTVWPNAAIVTTDVLRFLPDNIPDTVCPIGSILVASGGSAFTPNTTALTGLGTYYNYATLPVPSV